MKEKQLLLCIPACCLILRPTLAFSVWHAQEHGRPYIYYYQIQSIAIYYRGVSVKVGFPPPFVQLTVEWRDPGGGGGSHETTAAARSTMKSAQYKLSDRNVQLFAKGTSAAVL